VFDRLGTPAKLRFDGSEEILALTPERAPLGSLDMRRDDGRYVMRIYPEGRIVLFGPDGRDVRVELDEVADALAIAPTTKSAADATAVAFGEELTRASAASIAVAVEAKHLTGVVCGGRCPQDGAHRH
jgi:hypothetical protein